MEVLIYFLIGIITSLISYAFWCYAYKCNGKASSFYDYMNKNNAYDWIFFCFLLWPIALLGLIIIVIILIAHVITKWIRYKFGIDE